MIAPFFLGLTTQGFYRKESQWPEFPDVVGRAQVAVWVGGAEPGSVMVYSTMPVANSAASAQGVLRAMTISELPVDENLDGKFDRFEISAVVPLRAGESALSVTALATFRYNITGPFSLLTDAMAFTTFESARPGSMLTVSGRLRLRQKAVYAYSSMHLDTAPFLNDTLIDTFSSPDFLPTVLNAYHVKDVQPYFDQDYSLWTPGAERSFTLRWIVRVPFERVYYVPGFWETIKFAWIQYLALFAIFWFFIHWLRMYIFRYQIVETRVQQESVPKIKPF